MAYMSARVYKRMFMCVSAPVKSHAESLVGANLQAQLLHRENLQQKMFEVSGHLSRTLLSINPENILPPDMTLIPAASFSKAASMQPAASETLITTQTVPTALQ